jgi:hypothetical protein
MVQQPKFRPVQNCIFCGGKADSREHGWSDWAIRQFGAPSRGIAGQVDGMPFYDRRQRAVLIRCVCISCNTTWMKALEDSVIPTVGRMAERQATPLSVLQQVDIARWAVVKAMVWEYVTRQHDLFYSADDRGMVKRGMLPPNTVVWLSGHVGQEKFFAVGSRASSLSPDAVQLDGYFTTFGYKHVVVQVMTVRPYDHPDPYSQIDCNQTLWKDAIITIWPTTEPKVWPPLSLLDHAMLETFHQRCAKARIRHDGSLAPLLTAGVSERSAWRGV